MDFSAYLTEERERIDRFLDDVLPPADSTLHESMRYSVFAGGKRLRPVLAIAAHDAVGGRSQDILNVAAALELIHTYSLIHDDLPAMDNDDFRRGRPTNHKAFGESMAILAGDALLTLAFELASRPGSHTGAERAGDQPCDCHRLAVIREIAVGAGSRGMVGGQAVDIQSEGTRINAEQLEYIHTHKTGKLIRASVRVGALMGRATPAALEHLTKYSENIGLAFQIRDDILNVVGETEELGKSANSDAARGKPTYPSMFGVEASKRMVQELTGRAMKELDIFGEPAEPLRALAVYLSSRTS